MHKTNQLARSRVSASPRVGKTSMKMKLLAAALAGFLSLATSAPAWAAIAEICDDLEQSRNSGINDAQTQIDEEYEAQQTARDEMEKCMLDISGTLGSMVGSGRFSGIVDLIGGKLDKAACDEIRKRSNEAIAKLEQKRREAESAIKLPSGIGGGGPDFGNGSGAPIGSRTHMTNSSGLAALPGQGAPQSGVWDSLGKMLGQ